MDGSWNWILSSDLQKMTDGLVIYYVKAVENMENISDILKGRKGKKVKKVFKELPKRI